MDGDEVFQRLILPDRLAPGIAARLAGSGRAALLLHADGRGLVAHTAAAAALAAALRAGRLGPAPFADVARRPLPADAVRLERLPLDPGRLRPPVLCACAAVRTADDRPALLVILEGAPARGAPLPPPAEAEPAPAALAPAKPVRTRFVWASDAEGRITRASPALVETAGADLVGAAWADLLGTRVLDPEGRLAAALARRETFRGLPVRWRRGEAAEAVPADLSGVALRDDAQTFAGFGGFGLMDPSARAPAPPLPVASPVALAAPAVDPVPPAEAPPPPPEPPAPAASETVLPAFAALAGATMAEFVEIVGAPLAQLGMTWNFGSSPAPAEPEPEPEPDAAPGDDTPPDAPGPGGGPPATLAEPAEAPSTPEPPPRDDTVLSFNEHAAFREIALRLAGRFGAEETEAAEPLQPGYGEVTPFPAHAVSRRVPSEAVPEDPVHRVLDRLPVGLLVHRGDAVLFANRHLLDLLDFPALADLAAAGVARVLPGEEGPAREGGEAPAPVRLVPRTGGAVQADALRTTLAWEGAPAALVVVRRLPEVDPAQGLAAAELALRRREARLREARAVLDAVPDGVVTVDAEDRVVDLNQGARDLFGYDPREVVGEPVAFLFAPRDRARALAFLHRVRGTGAAAVLDPEVRGSGAGAGELPLALTAAPLAGDAPHRLGLVLRDVSALRRVEAELRQVRHALDAARAGKADLLAAMARGIRAPLDRIAALAASLLESADAPADPERTAQGLRAIRAAGTQVTSLVDDLVDLARIEAGRTELAFTGVGLNDLVARCVAVMQPEAARERIVVRTSFAPNLPAVLADEGAMRRAALNVIGDAIRLTDPGGQVIVSTALSERGEVALRVRDTGAGMTPDELKAALRPLDGDAPDRRGAPGLGLPLTKALVEANRGSLQITSGKDEGTLVEVLFPPGRVLTA